MNSSQSNMQAGSRSNATDPAVIAGSASLDPAYDYKFSLIR
ncbi:MAG: hypothetical protein WBN57_03130 [Gammaproteobacteria bacterium]